jgi:hypothetical protein
MEPFPLYVSTDQDQRLWADDEWPLRSIDAGAQEGLGKAVDPSLFELPGPQYLICMGYCRNSWRA